MYKKGAELGHATAMYNLGVFYVHGWGGLSPNREMAQKLFVTAADCGQGDAKRALSLETSTQEQNDFADVEADPTSNDLTNVWFKLLNVNLEDNSPVGDSKTRSSSTSNDSGITDSEATYIHSISYVS